MCDKTDTFEDNPFAHLFPSVEEARKYSRQVAAKLVNEEKLSVTAKSPEEEPGTSRRGKQKVGALTEDKQSEQEKAKKESPLSKEERVNRIAEHVFGLTLNKDNDKSLVWLEEFSCDNKLIDVDNLEQILFERLLLEDPTQHLLNPPANTVVDNHVVQTEVITYLIECHKILNKFAKVKQNTEVKKEIDWMEELILRNATTALRQPELYENQDLNSQILQIFYDNQNGSDEEVTSFFNGIVSELIKDEGEIPDIVSNTFAPVFNFVHRKVANSNMINFEHVLVFSFLNMMASNKHLAEALIDHSTPKSPGSVFSDTLLGAIFCLSCLPKVKDGPYEYFDSPNVHAVKMAEDTVWPSLRCITDNLHQLFLTLLKASPEIKHKTLQWFADCLHANAGRSKIGAMDGHLVDFRNEFDSDGFMINLSAVLIRLCEPFVADFNSPKILKIDPTYCAAKISTKEEAFRRNCHMYNLHSETCLLPMEEGQERPVSDTFNFITECFFLAQKSLDLGFQVCAAKVKNLLKDLSDMQRAYSDVVASRGANDEVADHIQERMQAHMTRYLSIRAALLEPKTLNLLTKLHATTANWLIQILLHVDEPDMPHVLKTLKPLVIPLPEEVPVTLKCVPEFVLLNLTCFLSFIRRFNRRAIEENGFKWFEPILSVSIVFMGSSKRVSNPHLRANLAEAMEALLPNDDDDDLSMNPNPIGTACRSQLFMQHPLSQLIIPNLLNLFVSIEMTGQSVQFQEKFNYRRPMYLIMDYLWTHEEHRNIFKQLAREAEENMEAVTPPLFLRFLNLLINDAVFLLDEALSLMAQLKTMQAARESGDWAKLPMEERTQNEVSFIQMGMEAKLYNIMSRWTIHTLEFLTSGITSIFWHPVLVDRIAAMLNYFLHHLVGPNKKNFKVKDKDEYDFKPDVVVMDICKIYVHLYQSDAFCLAISQDGRSYNADLFRQAEDVLARIGGGALIGELKAVDEKVSLIASRQKLEEEMLPDAPEEFFDPIMSTLMTDPVILPSSRQIVDRTTIARHLLSDESDPFNRSPLTLDKVIPHDELRVRIDDWLKERRKRIQEQLQEKQQNSSENVEKSA